MAIKKMRGVVAFAFTVAALLMAGCSASQPVNKETIKVPFTDDGGWYAVFYGIQKAKVKSDKIDVEAKPLTIAAQIQAIGTKEYDVIGGPPSGVPAFLSQGLGVKIIGTALKPKGASLIFVKADSGIKSPADLKGKTIAMENPNSTANVIARLVLWKKYGFTFDLKGSDLKFVDAPQTNIPAMLALGKVEAGHYGHGPAFQSLKMSELRPIMDSTKEFIETFGFAPYSAIFLTYDEKIKAKPEAIREFLRVIKQSVDYTNSHKDEVFNAVAQEHGLDSAQIRYWWEAGYDFPVVLDADAEKAIDSLWKVLKEAGQLKDYPDIKSTIWR